MQIESWVESGLVRWVNGTLGIRVLLHEVKKKLARLSIPARTGSKL
jgi:hypothetical protein